MKQLPALFWAKKHLIANISTGWEVYYVTVSATRRPERLVSIGPRVEKRNIVSNVRTSPIFPFSTGNTILGQI